MLLIKNLKRIDSKLLKIWGLHILIFYPVCSFLEDNLEVHSLFFKQYIDPEFWKISLLSPLNGLLGFWEKFPFFIFMAFAISIVFNFFFKKRFFTNYTISLFISYMIIFLMHRYKGDIFYYIIPSLTITLIIQSVIFRKEIFKNI